MITEECLKAGKEQKQLISRAYKQSPKFASTILKNCLYKPTFTMCLHIDNVSFFNTLYFLGEGGCSVQYQIRISKEGVLSNLAACPPAIKSWVHE